MVEFYPFVRCALAAVSSHLIFNRVSLLFTLVSDFCLTCLLSCLHRHQYMPFDCGLMPSFLYSLNYFYFYVHRFLKFKFQYFGEKNKIIALGVGLWTIRNTLVEFPFIARLYMCFILLTLSCFAVRGSILTMLNFTLLLILSFSIWVPLISN